MWQWALSWLILGHFDVVANDIDFGRPQPPSLMKLGEL
jgi:hypothetical protein